MPYDPLTQLQMAMSVGKSRFYGKSADLALQYPDALEAYISFVGNNSFAATASSPIEIRPNFDPSAAAIETQMRLTAENLRSKTPTTETATQGIVVVEQPILLGVEPAEESVPIKSSRTLPKQKSVSKDATVKKAQAQSSKYESQKPAQVKPKSEETKKDSAQAKTASKKSSTQAQAAPKKDSTSAPSKPVDNATNAAAAPNFANSNPFANSPANVYAIYLSGASPETTQYIFYGEAAKSAKRLKAAGRLDYLLKPNFSKIKVREIDYEP